MPVSIVVKKGRLLFYFHLVIVSRVQLTVACSHSKAECPNPRVFKGTCRICDKEGHPAAECPDRAPDVCRNCKQEGMSLSFLPAVGMSIDFANWYFFETGHKTLDCKENRKLDRSQVADKSPEEAWADMKKASDERDIDDFRDALQVYSKACPDVTLQEIEKKMREDKFKIYLIALVRNAWKAFIILPLLTEFTGEKYFRRSHDGQFTRKTRLQVPSRLLLQRKTSPCQSQGSLAFHS